MDDAAQLDAIAATQIVGDAEVAYCWDLVRAGIQTRKLGLGNLRRVIAALREGSGATFDEVSIDVEPPGGDRAEVSLLDDVRTCGVAPLIAELERLVERAGGPASTSTPPPAPPPAGDAPGDEPMDLLGVLAGMLGTTPARLAGDPEAYRAHSERVRAATAALAAAVNDPAADDATRAAAAARLREVLAESAQAGGATMAQRAADVPGTLAALGIDLDRFADALRTVTEWLEQRTPAAGAAVDRLVAALDEAAAPFLGGETRAQRDAALDARARDSARAAIAARLGKTPKS